MDFPRSLILFATSRLPAVSACIRILSSVLYRKYLLPAEWIQISLEPQTGDVLMIKPSIEDIAALDSEKVELVLMTSRSNSTAYSRTAEITYYVYGHEYTRQITLGAK